VTRATGASPAGFASDFVRPRTGTGTPLHAVVIPATPAFNRRVRAYLTGEAA
jgi:hypothetical protein